MQGDDVGFGEEAVEADQLEAGRSVRYGSEASTLMPMARPAAPTRRAMRPVTDEAEHGAIELERGAGGGSGQALASAVGLCRQVLHDGGIQGINVCSAVDTEGASGASHIITPAAAAAGTSTLS